MLAKPSKKPGSRGSWLERRQLDGVAEVGEAADEPPGLDLLGAAVEVVGAEVRVDGAVLQHVVGRGQDRGRHRTRPLSSARGGRAGGGTGPAGSWPSCGWPPRRTAPAW